jgi:hypothetical protein
MFKPQPKPKKKETQKMSVREFREKYSGKSITTKGKTSGEKLKKRHSPQVRFYKSTAWIWFARYIKLTRSDNQGVVICATSKRNFLISDRNLHAGHCIKVFESNSTHMNTAFDERNVLPQSSQDNRFYGGRPEIMRDAIDKIHGEGTFAELTILSKHFKKYTDADLKELGAKYRKKTRDLLEEKGLKAWWK